MEPSRELDSRIAEKVIGYECVCDEEPLDCPVHACDDRDTLRPYSTDIAAAWVVWHKLMEHFFCCKISFISQRVPKCRVTLYRYAESVQFGDPSFEAVGETAMQAICLAALEAVGVEVGDD